MRGRKPKRVKLKGKDVAELHQLLHERSTPQAVAQRARILLGQADGHRVAAVAAKVDQNRTTIWRVCERYRNQGLQAALYDAPRPGRPRVFSPAHTVPN